MPATELALRFAYDGSAFESYARQPGRRTVEGALLEALGHEGLLAGSWRTGSRTDAGVSALENVARCALGRPHLKGLLPALQRHLPDGVWVTGAVSPPDGFDPRRAAWRQYAYLAVPDGEDVARMRTACDAFVGRHDVRAFARVEAGRSPQRTVLGFATEEADGLWRFTVRGESFLWNQVRRMVAAVLAVGRGEADEADIRGALRTGKPHRRFGLAPPEGLLLEQVHYDGLRWADEMGPMPEAGPQSALVEGHTRLAVAKHVRAIASPAGTARTAGSGDGP